MLSINESKIGDIVILQVAGKMLDTDAGHCQKK